MQKLEFKTYKNWLINHSRDYLRLADTVTILTYVTFLGFLDTKESRYSDNIERLYLDFLWYDKYLDLFRSDLSFNSNPLHIMLKYYIKGIEAIVKYDDVNTIDLILNCFCNNQYRKEYFDFAMNYILSFNERDDLTDIWLKYCL